MRIWDTGCCDHGCGSGACVCPGLAPAQAVQIVSADGLGRWHVPRASGHEAMYSVYTWKMDEVYVMWQAGTPESGVCLCVCVRAGGPSRVRCVAAGGRRGPRARGRGAYWSRFTARYCHPGGHSRRPFLEAVGNPYTCTRVRVATFTPAQGSAGMCSLGLGESWLFFCRSK